MSRKVIDESPASFLAAWDSVLLFLQCMTTTVAWLLAILHVCYIDVYLTCR